MNFFGNNNGFTLVEALVTLTVLSIAIVPAYSIASGSLDLAYSIKNNVVAANLAQEGVEVVRALRDDNWFENIPWDTGLLGCTAGCRVQWDSTSILPLDDNPPLSIDGDSGQYFYPPALGNKNTLTPFSRKITITSISANQLRIDSEITWQERNRDKSVVVEAHLFNWK